MGQGITAIARIEGNLTGLAPSELKSLQHLYRRKTHPELLAGPELLNSLAQITAQTGRQVGVLLDRRGRVRGVSVGTPHRIVVPDFDRSRTAAARLSGYRFLHTHPSGQGLDPDDLSDLALLRLDALAALVLDENEKPRAAETGRLLAAPSGTQVEGRIERTGLVPLDELPSDFLAQTLALERKLSREAGRLLPAEAERHTERAVLLCVTRSGRAQARARLSELSSLAATAGLAVVGEEVVRLREANPATLIGGGRLETLSIGALQRGATIFVFDCSLTPLQVKNLGEATELKIIDRTQLILDIFARHARSRDGKLQVELAQQRYRLPRLVGRNPALSRLAGGIGGQGPGETKLEIDRRRARERIARLEGELERLEAHRALGRKSRGEKGAARVSLVGYTNAGKSTLFNRLTRQTGGRGAHVENKLFATLDPLTRRLHLGSLESGAPRQCLASDTVGFIRDLPEELVQAFHATLEELSEADLLLHVVDASAPDWQEQQAAVEDTLKRLGLSQIPQILVYNKADRLRQEERRLPWPGYLVSAESGEGAEELREAIAKALFQQPKRAKGAEAKIAAVSGG